MLQLPADMLPLHVKGAVTVPATAAERASRTTGAKIRNLFAERVCATSYTRRACTQPTDPSTASCCWHCPLRGHELDRVIVGNLAAMIAPIARVRTEMEGRLRSADARSALHPCCRYPARRGERRRARSELLRWLMQRWRRAQWVHLRLRSAVSLHGLESISALVTAFGTMASPNAVRSKLEQRERT